MMMVKPCGEEGRYGRCGIGQGKGEEVQEVPYWHRRHGREASAGCLLGLNPKPNPKPSPPPTPYKP